MRSHPSFMFRKPKIKGIKMAKTHKPHVVQTEKIDTSSMTKKELAKYLPDADGTPI